MGSPTECKAKSVKARRRANYSENDSCKVLKKEQLIKTKRNTIVSKKKHIIGKENWKNMDTYGPKGWMAACKEASKLLGYWPVPIKKGTPFYITARKIYDANL